jgi:hypothetical protein
VRIGKSINISLRLGNCFRGFAAVLAESLRLSTIVNNFAAMPLQRRSLKSGAAIRKAGGFPQGQRQSLERNNSHELHLRKWNLFLAFVESKQGIPRVSVAV